MKISRTRPRLGAYALLVVALAAAGCQATGDGEPGPSVVIDHGEFVVATYELPRGDLRSDVLDLQGHVVFQMSYQAAAGTVSYGVPGGEPVVFPDGMVPTLAPQHLADATVRVYERVLRAASGVEPFDAPGCDGIPDSLETPCLSRCCADHDRCYAANGCSALSWCHLWGACRGCNIDVVACFATCDEFNHSIPGCESWPCGCDQWECYDAVTNQTYCSANGPCSTTPPPPPPPPGTPGTGTPGTGTPGSGTPGSRPSTTSPRGANTSSNAASLDNDHTTCSLMEPSNQLR